MSAGSPQGAPPQRHSWELFAFAFALALSLFIPRVHLSARATRVLEPVAAGCAAIGCAAGLGMLAVGTFS